MNSFLNSYLFLFLFLALILVYWGLGLWFGLDFIFWWYDVVAHFLGGAWVMSLAFLLKKKIGIEDTSLKSLALFVAMIGIVALVGVLWEFFEIILDRYITMAGFTYLPGVYEDTLSDLFFDLLGGAVMFFVL